MKIIITGRKESIEIMVEFNAGVLYVWKEKWDGEENGKGKRKKGR